jgi:leucyl/phenylalanyl-tRNA---protein transferase
MVAVLDQRMWFPDPRWARSDGLVAVGGDLSAERLLLAYRSGVFPWSAAPVTWWSPDPRGIFEIGHMHVPRSLARTLRRAPYEITINRAFDQVITACAAAPRRDSRSWISPDFIQAYTRLNRLGHAHSIECWQQERLVGGVYGVAIGGFFAGESMFHSADDASKIALIALDQHLARRGFVLFDTQMLTPTTRLLGAREIRRDEYLHRLAEAWDKPCQF